MKKLTFLFVLAILSTLKIHAGTLPKNRLHLFDPYCTFDKIWVDYDVYDGGDKGMRIHVKFSAYNMLYMDAYVAVYFEYNDELGGTLKDKNGKFNSTAGDVAVYKSIRPEYDPAVYEDLQIFMPYNELDLDPGNYELTMDVKAIYKQGGVISKLTRYDFEYTKPGSTTSNSSYQADAKFEDLWVDYDVYENGEKGMRIHVKFRVYNMKDVDCYLATYIQKKNGEKMYGTRSQYRSKSGQLAVYYLLTPGYTEAVYSDAKLFLPYNELNLASGRWDLKLDADVIYKNGDLLRHLKYYDFWYEH